MFDEDGAGEDEHGIRATYVTERFTYYYSRRADPPVVTDADRDGDGSTRGAVAPSGSTDRALEVTVRSATTTTGGPLTSSGHDATGILIWPATHLICQHVVASGGLPRAESAVATAATTAAAARTEADSDGDEASGGSSPSSPDPSAAAAVVLEVGCGVGLVGVAALLTSPPPSIALWVSTDADDRSLRLCRRNFDLNGIETEDEISASSSLASSSCRSWVRRFRWGDEARAGELLDELRSRTGRDRFDAVVGADVVYPSTSDRVLLSLFSSVDAVLMAGGTFWLSFATRDGTKTPVRLIEAASRSGFAVDALDEAIDDAARHRLPPLLDSRLLVLRRDPRAREKNVALGGVGCRAFPGLRAAVKKLEEDPWSDEEWDAPFVGDEDEEEAEEETG
jgi:SAM-dependent methyltransferase